MEGLPNLMVPQKIVILVRHTQIRMLKAIRRKVPRINGNMDKVQDWQV
jgi:hypothetical protein